MRLAVVKSALRSASRTWLSLLSANSISRSMMAPLEMRPTVGTPRTILAASPSAWKPLMATEPCADRIDVAVGAEQRGDQQGAALQALGVAQRRDRHVDAGALGAERRQVAGHHDGGHVAGADGGAADVDAEPLQHGLQRLLGERDIVQRVAGAVEADDQAVADQLVLAHALDIGEVLDARGRAGRRRRRRSRPKSRRRPRRARSQTSSSYCSPMMSSDRAQSLRIACHPAGAGKPLKSKDIISAPGSGPIRAGPFLAGPADFAGLFTAR